MLSRVPGCRLRMKKEGNAKVERWPHLGRGKETRVGCSHHIKLFEERNGTTQIRLGFTIQPRCA